MNLKQLTGTNIQLNLKVLIKASACVFVDTDVLREVFITSKNIFQCFMLWSSIGCTLHNARVRRPFYETTGALSNIVIFSVVIIWACMVKRLKCKNICLYLLPFGLETEKSMLEDTNVLIKLQISSKKEPQMTLYCTFVHCLKNMP